jgi:hypothetical protein
MRPKDIAEKVNGKFYFTVKHFAWATHRSEQSVRFLISKGNRLRKLKATWDRGRRMIPYSELTEYPFTVSGRAQEEVYHYDEDGAIAREEVKSGTT